MSDAAPRNFPSSYGLRESGLSRLIRTTYHLLGRDFVFYPRGEDECRAWTIPVKYARARKVLSHFTPIWQKHLIRAETIRWDHLLGPGSEAHTLVPRHSSASTGPGLHCARTAT